MQLITFKFFAAFSIFCISLASGLLQLNIAKNKAHLLCLADAFASGVFLSAALLHLLPEADKGFNYILGNGCYPIAPLICLASFAILFAMERGICINGKYLILLLTIHSLIEGATIGSNTCFLEALIIFFAVIAHKGSEIFSLATNLHNHHIQPQKIKQIIAAFSCITPLGIFIASFVIHIIQTKAGSILNSAFNAIAAGTFLYLGTEHLVECKKSLRTYNEIALLTLGMVLIALVAIWV